jgi:drug/metabolite transporter (DMT)-like permease
MDRPRPADITVVATIMVLFGAAEIVTGFAHNFFGLHTAPGALSTYVGAIIGTLYAAAGFLVFAMKRSWAICCLIIVVGGRIAMVLSGLYPIETLKQIAGIVAGTLIAAVFAVYIGLRARQPT